LGTGERIRRFRSQRRIDCSLGGVSQQLLQFRQGVFDWVEVAPVGREIKQCAKFVVARRGRHGAFGERLLQEFADR
jgi:hypothetical protein